jgi:hypothetical protein
MPRPPSPPLPHLPCPRWPDPAAYWAEPFDPAACADVADKYAVLGELVRWPDGALRTRGLRDAASRWPGSLRECQIVVPAIYVGRGARARLGARSPALPRGRWRAEGFAAIPLWHDLAGFYRDLVRLRGLPLGEGLTRLPGDRRTCWPEDVREWPAEGRDRPSARWMESWLAAIAGLEPVELAALLRGPASADAPRPI